MRKVRLGMNVTLDGYVAGPNGELDWLFPNVTPAQLQMVTGFLREVDTILIGHATYLEQAAHWPTQTGEMADLLNRHAKVVFASSPETLDWNNSRLATRDAAAEIAALKAQPGNDIFVTGGASLAQSLARQGLIDEYSLIVHPLVLGSGKPLFKDGAAPQHLRLVSARPFESGAIHLIYERA